MLYKLLLLLVFLSGSGGLLAQPPHSDYLGAGHTTGIRVSSSPTATPWSAAATLDRSGLDSAYMRVQASRFLAQATFGSDRDLIESVAATGLENWINQQLLVPPTRMVPELDRALDHFYEICLELGGIPEDVDGFEEGCEFFLYDFPGKFTYPWMQAVLTGKDQLRQRVAFALSEIFVVSGVSKEEEYAYALSNYYDLLLTHAFGSFEDLLFDITLNPVMGEYLSHLNNPKTDTVANIRPDENFAREIMQLFTIGLFELNLDGTQKLDPNGQPIPTYDNNDIKEFAKVFTGLGDGDPEGQFGVPADDDFFINYQLPMRMYEAQHEPGEKRLLNGFVLPNGQTGLEDIRQTVHHLAGHPNTAPFITYRLIQRLVKSNPSPAYVRRVATVFENDGSGQRGNLGAVVKAILLDPEARECSWTQLNDNGKLREPLLRYTHYLRALEAQNESEIYWSFLETFDFFMRQRPLFAPSVFNFFLPDYQPNGPVAEAGLVAPEFQMHNSSSAISWYNIVNTWTVEEWLLEVATEYELFRQEPPESYGVYADWSEYLQIQNDAVLIDELSLLLCHDQLSANTRTIVLNALQAVGEFDPEDRMRMALYLILISPDYNVIR